MFNVISPKSVVRSGATLLFLGVLAAAFTPARSSAVPFVSSGMQRTKTLIDAGWRFRPLDSTSTNPIPDEAGASYDDSSWRTVQLPHDYVVENKFSPDADSDHGFLPTNVAWYRKHIHVPSVAPGAHLWLEFDGVYRDSKVWLNGTLLGEHQSGYTSFYYDVTDTAKPGADNVIAVRVDPSKTEGWFYEGGGIYRHVWLTTVPPIHVGHWGTFVTSTVEGLSNGTASSASILDQTDIVNETSSPETATVETDIIDGTGAKVASGTTDVNLGPGLTPAVPIKLSVTNPHLWSPDSPNMYSAETTVLVGNKVVDSYDTPFGIRDIKVDPNLGLLVNGLHVKIQGTCNHQDVAGIGIGVPDNMLAWRVSKLKAFGCNGYRMSHNPPAVELLDDCDQQGLLVLDENRHFGTTYIKKSDLNTPYNDLTDLKDMVLRDRNHPSIYAWSMGNEEVALEGTPHGYEILKAMRDTTKSIDPSRPVTIVNVSWRPDLDFTHDLDIISLNYNSWRYDTVHKANPALPIESSEFATSYSTRGIYANDAKNAYVAAYDTEAPSWGSVIHEAWAAIASREWFMGGFIWTGFDYRGEPTPYKWPAINSGFGVMDTCGFAKDNYYYLKANWVAPTTPVVHILPHWNWAGREGQPIKVWVYSNGDEVELTVNGVSQGRQKVPQYGHAEWTIPYAPGSLTAVGYKDGKPFGSDKVETAGAPAALKLRSDITKLNANGEDVSPIEITVVDAKGRTCPTADNNVVFTVSGPGVVAGVGNGNPSSHEPDFASQRMAFNGKCMVLVRATTNGGKIVLHAKADGLPEATITIRSH